MNIKTAFLFFFLVSFYQVVSAQDEAIFASEKARFDAQIEKDVNALDQLLADELIYIHSNTLLETKTDFIQSVQSGKIVYQAMDVQHHKIRRYKKIAVVTGLVQVSGLYKGTSFIVDLHYTSIYKKKKKQWLLVSWQSTSKK